MEEIKAPKLVKAEDAKVDELETNRTIIDIDLQLAQYNEAVANGTLSKKEQEEEEEFEKILNTPLSKYFNV